MVIELPPLFAYFVRAQHFVEPLNDAKDSARRTEGLTECHGAKRREHYTRITLLLPTPSLSAAYLGAHSGADQPYYAPWLPLLPACLPAIRPMESKGFFLFCAESVAPFPAQRSPSTDPHGAMRPLPTWDVSFIRGWSYGELDIQTPHAFLVTPDSFSKFDQHDHCTES